ncbi:MAG: neutral/alkaline non-lysosomal ceramidase N-terminal domain-containing protein [Gemmataceae bacterium]|nr:neutral/alkaline non-lysosomal ceramidase N-terminal domain-containing protein [Gemmataceae bacterium]
MRLLASLASTLALALPVAAGTLTAGAAAVDVTPPKGCPMAGYYSARGAEGTHDPLLAKALVFEKDGTRVALVGLDLITTPRSLVEETRKRVEKQTGIPGAHVMLSATHSHTGPVLSDGSPFADTFGGGKIAKEYIAGLPEKIAEAVKKADDARKPARVSFGTGKEEGLAFNRRFHMSDGSVGWNPGKKNPNIVRPAGPTDPGVPVVLVETDDKPPKPLAVYVNFALHLDTVGGLEYSADYPYTLSKSLAAAKGDGLVTVFTAGCCGDINHLNVNSDKPQKGHGEAARIGTRLAAEVLRVLDDTAPVDGALRVSSESVEFALAPVSADDVRAAKLVLADLEKGVKPVPKFLDQVQAFKALDVSGRLGKPYQVEVQVISLGRELAWVSLPGEIFVELGLQIKRGSPFRQTMIAELANGSIGYVPNRAAYPQGNYEVISARCAEGSGEKLVDSALKQLRSQFKDGKK